MTKSALNLALFFTKNFSSQVIAKEIVQFASLLIKRKMTLNTVSKPGNRKVKSLRY